MKSATIPSLRVTPDLRKAAENVLHEGETLSNFVEESLRSQIEQRQMQRQFIERGLAARDEARASGTYASQTEVMDSLRSILKKAEQR
ncbi:YlcI/YnfO family protein [Hydrocarboniphaga sp.]|uniref:YlcI/YnfO family protein n=1 Tax=Hydrocarboniphaga sp. TaxID=2033016 RepID=UPI003D0A3A86